MSFIPHNPDCCESVWFLRASANTEFKRFNVYWRFCIHRSIFPAIISGAQLRFLAAWIMTSQICWRREYAFRQSSFCRHLAPNSWSSCRIGGADGPPVLWGMPLLYSLHKSITEFTWLARRCCWTELDSDDIYPLFVDNCKGRSFDIDVTIAAIRERWVLSIVEGMFWRDMGTLGSALVLMRQLATSEVGFGTEFEFVKE